MKTKFFLLALMIFPFITMGQIVQKTVSEVKVSPPEFTGIQQKVELSERSADLLNAYLTKNFIYPESVAECQVEGTGIIQFLVQPNGKLRDFKVVNSVCPMIDNEFIRVLKTTGGMWKPGYNNNKATAMEKEISMIFVVTRTGMNNPQEYFLKNAQMLFEKGNKSFLVKGNPEKALRFYNRSIKYMPKEASSLLLRGLCRYEIGDNAGACSDWNRINSIGTYDADLFLENLCELKGYEEMTQILQVSEK